LELYRVISRKGRNAVSAAMTQTLKQAHHDLFNTGGCKVCRWAGLHVHCHTKATLGNTVSHFYPK
jgi:hypothetical protein